MLGTVGLGLNYGASVLFGRILIPDDGIYRQYCPELSSLSHRTCYWINYCHLMTKNSVLILRQYSLFFASGYWEPQYSGWNLFLVERFSIFK
ncbi:MAG: hypothetical protein ICV56_02860 [Nitrososphaeraceae archaeon]|nr:hypothetical protein [Nitrososphaeraceae archaeon]